MNLNLVGIRATSKVRQTSFENPSPCERIGHLQGSDGTCWNIDRYNIAMNFKVHQTALDLHKELKRISSIRSKKKLESGKSESIE